MTEPEQSVWERLYELSDEEIAQLTTAAITVLGEHADSGAEPLSKLPRNVLIAETRTALDSEGLSLGDAEAGELVSDADLSRSLSLSLLQSVQSSPVRADVEALYRRLRDMMILDGGLLLGGAVLLLVLKLKRVKVGDTEIEFFDVKADVLNAIKSFLGGA